ncbi:MAG: hypothetical protein GX102_15365 [Porphyromonadaceae bacterium]|nr:hypothetical protein [Porphyromonadaceae bacterium]
MAGTDIYYLSGIRSVQSTPQTVENPDYIWFGEFSEEYSKAKMSLLSFLELKISESVLIKNKKALAEHFNDLDMLRLSIYAIEHTSTKDSFTNACKVIAGMSYEGLIHSDETDLNYRSTHLQYLIQTLNFRIYTPFAGIMDSYVFDFLNEHAIKFYGTDTISGIGSTAKQREAAKKIKESAMYYIYRYVKESDLHKYPIAVLRKRKIQNRVYQFVDETDGYNSSTIQANLVRSGIIEQTGMTPEKFLSSQNIRQYRLSGIGEPITFTTVIGVITALLGLVRLIVELFKPKRQPPTESEVNSGLSDFQTDFPPIGSNQSNSNNKDDTITSSLASAGLPLILAGVAALSFFKKK